VVFFAWCGLRRIALLLLISSRTDGWLASQIRVVRAEMGAEQSQPQPEEALQSTNKPLPTVLSVPSRRCPRPRAESTEASLIDAEKAEMQGADLVAIDRAAKIESCSGHELGLKAQQQSSALPSVPSCSEEQLWVMRAQKFVGLSRESNSHLEAQRCGLLQRWDSSMEVVFLVSQEWSSYDQPDHSGARLECMQQVIRQMLAGTYPDVEPLLQDRLYLQGKGISSKRWKQLARRAHIISDCFSMQQLTVSAYELAARASTHLFIVCPPSVRHRDDGHSCDLASWLAQSWSRFQMLMVRVHHLERVPVVVVRGWHQHPSPFLLGAHRCESL
jgi:hypothetical protein